MSEEDQGVANSSSPAKSSEAPRVTRRDFLKLSGIALAATKLPDILPPINDPEVIDVNFGSTGEVGIQAYPAEGRVKCYLRPYASDRSETTLTHIGTSKSSELAPRQLIYKAGEVAVAIQRAVAKGLMRESTVEKYRLVGSLFPTEVAARLATVLKNKAETHGLRPDSVAKVDNLSGEDFEWSIKQNELEYKGNGFVRIINENDRVHFVSGEDFPGKNVISMKTSSWLRQFTGVDEVVNHCIEKFGDMPLEHTVPNAFVIESAKDVNGEVQVAAVAGSYAQPMMVSYANEVLSDRSLSPVEYNFLNTLAPYVVGTNKPNEQDSQWISEFADKTFNKWKENSPELPFHQGQTLVFNKDDGTFKIIEKKDRQAAINSLSSNEVWITPGDIMLLDGEKHYKDELYSDEANDMTINGLLIAPQKDGSFKPVAVVSTDQLKRFSLSHTEQMANSLRERLNFPKGTLLLNMDKRGAGGVITGIRRPN